MSEETPLSEIWARYLKHWGLSRLALPFLIGIKPLTLLVAQLLHMGAGVWSSENTLSHNASTFEEEGFWEQLSNLLLKDNGSE